MTWILFVNGLVLLIGSGSMENKGWRQQLHCWFGAWTGIIIMIVAISWEYGQ